MRKTKPESKVKACKCGKHPDIYKDELDSWWVMCPNVGCENNCDYLNADTKKEAIRLWNTRSKEKK